MKIHVHGDACTLNEHFVYVPVHTLYVSMVSKGTYIHRCVHVCVVCVCAYVSSDK